MNPKLTKKIQEAVKLYFKEKEETLVDIEVYIFDFVLPEDTVLYSNQEYSIPLIQGKFNGRLMKKDGLSVVSHFDIRNVKIRYDNQIIDFQIIDFGHFFNFPH